MENEKKVSSQGRVLRPRRDAAVNGDRPRTTSFSRDGEHRNYGEHRSYGEHRHYGEGRPSGTRRPYGDHGSEGSGRPHGFAGRHDSRGAGHDSDRGNFGERRNFSRDGERRNFGEHRNFGERNNFGERSNFGERRSGERRPMSSDGERRSFGGERKPFGGERRSFGEGRGYGERRTGASRQGGFGRGGRRPYGNTEPHFDEREGYGINRMLSRKPQVNDAAYSDNDTVKTSVQEEVRLNRFIANSGVCSRREADTYIQAGVVTVNGEVVTELGTKVNVLKDDVRFNGERLKGEEKVYVLMNKPKGYVTTASDPHAEKTVMDLLKGCNGRVFPVGRLDKATTGVLMFTNDGEMAERLTHPSYDKKKIYQVLLDHELTDQDYQRILSGVTLSDGEIAADELEYIDEHDHRKLGIEIHSGKNRIVRRIFESLGYDVKALDRVYFAGLTKKGLQKGEWRYLTEGEVNILKMGAYV